MRRRALGVSLLGLPFVARGVRADASVLRLSKQYGLPYLSMIVMEEQRLLEAQLARRGLPNTRVEWTSVAGPAQQLDGLLSGQYDVIGPGVPTLATVWDKTVGTALEARALCALQSMPYVLITRSPGVHSVADFTEKDRIALPAVKLTGHALALEMECARRWGAAEFGRLDPLTVTMSHPDAMVQMLTPSSTITAHFASSPFHYYELALPGMRQILKSYDVVGSRHTNGTLIATKRFHDANPAAYAFIAAEPHQAAEIYQRATRETRSTLDQLTTMVADPDVSYTTTPIATMAFIDFMHGVGRLRHRPAQWKDMFFPEAHDLNGS
jgi:NitT/TauT family transport system substrate-binding protein